MNIASKLHHAFNLYAENIAISEEEEKITYSFLYQQSLKIAAFLINKKIKNSCIAIEIENTTHHITAILGVIFSGNYYVSVTPDNKPFFLAENSVQPEFIICAGNELDLNKEISITNILKEKNDDCSIVNHLNISLFDALCAFFTSGSSGKSKIIIHNHQDILKDTLRQIEDNQINQLDKLDLIFSLSFSASLACIFPAFFAGAELCVFNFKQKGLHLLADFWQQKKITFSTLSVSTFQSLCKTFTSFHHLSALRFISISAEPVKNTTINFFKLKFPAHVVLQIAYASTETRTISEIKIYNDERLSCFSESVGKPVAEKQVIIKGINGEKLPLGEVGEIVVQSKYITDKYYGQPFESAASFSKHGDIINYKTGDLGYLNADGYLFYCGRTKCENKINGIKINISEIEEEVEKISGVLQSIVVINRIHFEQPKLVCFFKAENFFNNCEHVIKPKLGNNLPPSHLPHIFIQVEKFPYTHSGKIDRKKLEQAEIKNTETSNSLAQIKSTVDDWESKIIYTFKKVLETDNINADSNFFDCGGDSLASLLCIVEIENQLKITIPTFEFINYPTPKKLSQFITSVNKKTPVLVKEVYLNGYNVNKKNLYLLSHSVNNSYQCFINGTLAADFNLIELFYDLHKSYKIETGADLIINQLTKVVNKHNGSVVMGLSFNGYIAHQLACVVPKISFCILIDTYDYFNYEKYKVQQTTKEKIKMLLWQTVKNKDYTLPLFWMKRRFKSFKPRKKCVVDKTDFLKGINYFLNNINNKTAINNCIYFQASRTFMFLKNPGFAWKSYVAGEFYFFTFPSLHKTIIKNNNEEMANQINSLTRQIKVLPECDKNEI